MPEIVRWIRTIRRTISLDTSAYTSREIRDLVIEACSRGWAFEGADEVGDTAFLRFTITEEWDAPAESGQQIDVSEDE